MRHIACRNILVCDSTEEAKQLSWGQGGERHKVATLEGTLFSKAGTITGGMAGNLVGRAQRWGDKDYDALKKVPCLGNKPACFVWDGSLSTFTYRPCHFILQEAQQWLSAPLQV